jgi:hypothetical protein
MIRVSLLVTIKTDVLTSEDNDADAIRMAESVARGKYPDAASIEARELETVEEPAAPVAP